ncbi:flagellar hook-length control protein FliK [Nocardioides pyridinolyticus]
MSTVPAALPGTIPLPGAQALPGTTPNPHDPSADPFLALLTQLVGPAAGAASTVPGQAAPGPHDAEGRAQEDTTPTSEDAPVETGALPAVALTAPPVLPVSALAVPAPTVAPTAADEATAPASLASRHGQPGPAAAAEPVAPASTNAAAAPETAALPPAPAAPAPAGSAPVAVAPASVAAVTAVAAPAATSEGPAPVAQQVFPEVVRAAGTGVTPNRVVVRLQPEHLGEVRVVLRTDRSGALEVSLAGGPEARAAIREGAPELLRMLEVAGSHDAKVVVRHLAEAAAAGPVSSTAGGPATTTRTDVPTPTGDLLTDAGSTGGTAAGASHGEERRGQNPQDARPGAMDGIPDPTVETTRPAARRAGGLDVMM